MDFIEGLPISKGKDKILAIVDKLTKYAHFMGVRKIDSTKQKVEVFYKNIYKLHGLSVIEIPILKGIFGGIFANKSGHLLI
jgi:hypothetical protein